MTFHFVTEKVEMARTERFELPVFWCVAPFPVMRSNCATESIELRIWGGPYTVHVRKKHRAKPCVYCGQALATTMDHVFAREFFLERQRGNHPKVPACSSCNSKKSQLEGYLTTVLPFGARHGVAAENLSTSVPKRLRGNARLHRELAAGAVFAGPSGQSAMTLLASTVPIDSAKLEELFVLIAKGLLYSHWGIVLGVGDSAIAAMITDAAGDIFDQIFFGLKARDRLSFTVGEGTFAYEGLQGDPPQLSLWKFSTYGGVQLTGDPNAPGHTSSRIYAVTGPNDVVEHMRASVFARNTDDRASSSAEALPDGEAGATVDGFS